jgi:hypothetical protein
MPVYPGALRIARYSDKWATILRAEAAMRRFAIACMACALFSIVSGQSTAPQATSVHVVMLGTGTPLPDPERSGPSIAVVVDNHAYLFDAGTGIVRRAAAATTHKGIAGLEPRTLRVAFLTHLHSDPTVASSATSPPVPSPACSYLHRGNAGCDQSHAAGCIESGSEEQMLKETKQYYSGKVVAAHDLDVY